MTKKLTVVLGASPKPQRFSNKALRLLTTHGHPVIPVHPLHKEIEGLKVAHSIEAIDQPVDTVTVYLSPDTGAKMGPALLKLKPKRVIFNPGAESEVLEEALKGSGIEIVRDCTLVMLGAGKF